MGKSLELLGLASFNVFIALILSTTFLSHAGAGRVNGLTEANVRSFIQEVSDISAGNRKDMDSYSITSWLMDHVAPEGHFKTTLRYSIPDMPDDERQMDMDKMTFISQTLQGLHAMESRETKVNVEYIQIEPGGKSASVMVTNYERGMIPVDDGSGMSVIMPVQGTSYCEQRVVLNEDRRIQIAGAICTTDLSFLESL